MSSGNYGVVDNFFSSVKFLCWCEGANNSTTFVDYSLPLNATITPSGTAKISTAVFPLGALLLDGTTGSSGIISSKSCNIGAGAFTLEALIRPTVAQTGRIISSQDGTLPNAVVMYRVDTAGSLTGFVRNSSGTGLVVLTSATGLVAMNGSQEYWTAYQRDGSGNMVLLLGVPGGNYSVVATGTGTTNPGGNAYQVGWFTGTQELFGGNIRQCRITEGVARYATTGVMQVPQVPYFPSNIL